MREQWKTDHAVPASQREKRPPATSRKGHRVSTLPKHFVRSPGRCANPDCSADVSFVHRESGECLACFVKQAGGRR